MFTLNYHQLHLVQRWISARRAALTAAQEEQFQQEAERLEQHRSQVENPLVPILEDLLKNA